MSYIKLETLPEYETVIWGTDDKGRSTVLNKGDKPLWSADFPPPQIGEEITITINRIGAATVTGYFTCDGWLGVLSRVHNPPDWFVRQNGLNCESGAFGTEIRLRGTTNA